MSLRPDDASAICAFIYNVVSGIKVHFDDKPTAICIKNLTHSHNMQGKLSGEYYVGRDLFELSKLSIAFPIYDLGITILMMFFAKFLSRNQYDIFIMAFKNIKELEHLESFILNPISRRCVLPDNLSIHDTYGLKRLSSTYTSNDCLGLEQFKAITGTLMPSKHLTPLVFTTTIQRFHISIIASFYCFTSLTCNAKMVKDCRELSQTSLNYTFVPPTKAFNYNGDFWFQLPRGAIWFAYENSAIKYSTYISRDVNRMMDVFSNLNIRHRIMGFVHNNQLYPVKIYDPNLMGQWANVVGTLQSYNLNCILNDSTILRPPLNCNNLYFVRNNYELIYKYIQRSIVDG